ncbi:MAG: hypothetical protein V1647_05205 [Pseudomonadota bacterium]
MRKSLAICLILFSASYAYSEFYDNQYPDAYTLEFKGPIMDRNTNLPVSKKAEFSLTVAPKEERNDYYNFVGYVQWESQDNGRIHSCKLRSRGSCVMPAGFSAETQSDCLENGQNCLCPDKKGDGYNFLVSSKATFICGNDEDRIILACAE